MINVFQPSLGEEELAAVRAVFETNWVGRGRRVTAFENSFAEFLRVPSSSMIATTCASEGLFTAAEVLGWVPGDEVVIPTVGFVAAASAVCRVGATPVFCDVEYRTLNPTPDEIERASSPRTKGVILNHYGGYPAPVADIAAFCASRRIDLVEDAACAVATVVDGKAAGTFGTIGVWSFDGMKILVTGDGGMVYAANPDVERAMRQAMYLGMPLEESSGVERSQTAKGRWWEFEIDTFGRRAIMNDITAAVGLVQLRRLPTFLARRAEIASRYTQGLRHLPGLCVRPDPPSGTRITDYLYWIQLERRDELAQYLKENGVYTTFRYWPLHKVTKFGSRAVLPSADRAARTTLNLPCHQALSDPDVDRIVELVRSFAGSN